MSNHLSTIKDFLKNYTETLSEILKLDFYIVDHNMIRIVCTGKFKYVLGAPLSKHSISYHVYNSGQQIYIDNPGVNPLCDLCEVKVTGNCRMEHAMYHPIQFEGQIIGVIVVYAITEEQKKLMKNIQKEINMVFNNFSEIVSTKLIENRDVSRYNYLLSNIDEGVIITDYNGNILIENKNFLTTSKNTKNIRDLIDEKYLILLESVDNGERIKAKNNNSTDEFFISKFFVDIEDRFSDIIFILYFTEKSKKKSLLKIVETENIIGSSPDITMLKSKVNKASRYNFSVLILGESGTGKGMVAKAIHENSDRSEHPFVAINCSAIPENLLESELFGYDAGAFSGADKNGKAGSFELANNGTLFLDEIGDMSLALQPKILKVLDNQVIRRVGGVKDMKLDIRVIAATNKDIQSMIRDGQFRSDLYFRLSVMNIEISPLKNRAEDIVSISNYFLEKYNKKYNKKIMRISDKVIRRFLSYDWPGNVRELDNVIKYAVAMEDKNILNINSLPEHYKANNNNLNDYSLSNIKKNTILKLLREYDGQPYAKQIIAQELGISLSTLYRYMKTFEIK